MDYRNIKRKPSSFNELFIDSVKILKYLIGNDDAMDTLIICNPRKVRLVTTDQEIYQALCSIRKDDCFKLNKLTKFFEVVSVRTVARKKILTDEAVEFLRRNSLTK